jgi:hypothetical protein
LYIEHIQSCRDGLTTFLENNQENGIPVKLQELIKDLLDSFDMTLSLENDDPAYDAVLEYILRSNKRFQVKIAKFIRENSSMDRKSLKKADTFIRKTMGEWKEHITEQGSIMNTKDSTLSYIRPFFHKMIHELGQIFPQMILNGIPTKPPQYIPPNWVKGAMKLSVNDLSEITQSLQNLYSTLQQFVGTPGTQNINENDSEIADQSALLGNQTSALISPVLHAVIRDSEEIIQFIESIPFLATIDINSSRQIKSVFNQEIVFEILLFSFYRVCELFIEYSSRSLDRNGNIVDNLEPALASTAGEAKDEAQLLAEGAQMNTELDMVQADTTNRQKSVANYLISCIVIFNDRKQIINVNYDDIHQKILQLKEREKKRMTDKLEAMSNDQRRAQNLMKNLRLEEWSAGQQKGLTQYVEKTQDQERQEAVEQIIQERSAREQGASDMNIDLFMLDVEQEMQAAQEIEQEAYDMSGLPEDDDYGDQDGDM